MTTARFRPSRLVIAMALAAALAVSQAQGDPFQLPRQRATAQLVVDAAAATDADVQAAIATANTQARQWWQAMDHSPGRTELWNDLGSLTRSARNTASMNRLRAMAVAYAQSGSGWSDGAQLLQDTRDGLDWLVATYYNAASPFTDNWWDWEIGTPQALNDCMLALYGQLSGSQRSSYIAAIDRWVPDPTRRTTQAGVTETGANRLDKALVVAWRGLIGADSAKVDAGRNAISQTLPFVTTGDGFYADGSFIQHTNVAYTGSYGAVAISSLSRLLAVLDGTSWAVTDAQVANVDVWIRDAFLPVLQGGAALDNLRGRAISRADQELTQGRSIVHDVLALARRSTAADKASFLAALKAQVQQDQRRASYYEGISAPAAADVKALMADNTVLATPLASQSRAYASMARAVHRRPGFLWSLATFSPRISAFEAGNGENTRGWYTGLGATTLLTTDTQQYIDGYWPTVDFTRLAGVTTDGWMGTPGNFKSYLNPKTWVGGAALASWGQVQGMQYDGTTLKGSEGTSSPVSGSKSWFAFGDTVIALGSGIASTGSTAVETIVDNRKLIQADGADALSIDGVAQSTAYGTRAAAIAHSAYLTQPGLNTGIGYLLPDLPGGGAQNLQVKRELRTGSWSAINAGGSTAPLSRPYLSLSLPHGTQPANARYAYAMLPGVSATSFAAIAAAPGLELLQLDGAAHAVWDGRSSMGGAAFWADAATTVSRQGAPWLTADRKAAVVLREAGGELSLAVAEPTQTATGTLLLERLRPVNQVLSRDPAITVLATAPTLRMSVALSSLRGRSLQLRASLPASASTTTDADASVRDGSYASTNYGSSVVLDVKNDGVGYNRRSVLRMPLTGLPKALRAQLKLAVSAAGTGTGGAAIVNAVYGCSGSWNESTVTWATQPAQGTELARWSVAPAGTVQWVDVTAAVQSAQTAGQSTLCLMLAAPSNQGASAWVQYAAREKGASSAAQLIIN